MNPVAEEWDMGDCCTTENDLLKSGVLPPPPNPGELSILPSECFSLAADVCVVEGFLLPLLAC